MEKVFIYLISKAGIYNHCFFQLDNYLLDRQLKDEIRNLLEARGQVAYKDILARIDSFLPEVVRNKPQDYLLNKMIDWPELIKISENNICSLNVFSRWTRDHFIRKIIRLVSAPLQTALRGLSASIVRLMSC